MYAVINGNNYADINRLVRSNEIIYQGESLVNINTVSGTIKTYLNNEFLLAEDSVSDYARQVISDGMIVLTNVPEPTPEPEPPEPEPETDVWSEMADAIKAGVNSVD